MDYNIIFSKDKKSTLEMLKEFVEVSTHDRFRLPGELKEDTVEEKKDDS